MAKPRRPLTDEELRLWREAMRETRRLRRGAGEPAEGAVPEPDLGAEPALPVPRQPRSLPPPPAARPPLQHGVAPGLDRRSLERLRRGELPVDRRLDLHGLTQDAAHALLTRAVLDAAAAGQRCLLVITGKGRREGAGVLREQVPRWLNEGGLRPLLLAFVHAPARHGGEGALYVLLKRKR